MASMPASKASEVAVEAAPDPAADAQSGPSEMTFDHSAACEVRGAAGRKPVN